MRQLQLVASYCCCFALAHFAAAVAAAGVHVLAWLLQLAGGADNQCGLLQGYKLKDRPEGPGLLLKQFRVKVLTLQGEVITHADADSNYALSDVTGRPSMPIEEFLNELLVAAYAAGRNNALFPVEGITLVIERVQGHPWEGLSAEQQAAWHEAHPGVAAPGPLPEGGLVLVSLGLLVPYRGRDMGSLREELVKSPQVGGWIHWCLTAARLWCTQECPGVGVIHVWLAVCTVSIGRCLWLHHTTHNPAC
jgi:hypothetical protein